MDWVIRTFSSSVGKKSLMAVTGLGFVGFLAGHLAGNFTAYLGPAALNGYATHLHELALVVKAAEIGLVLFACVHVTTGLLLFIQNLAARPERYSGKKWAGGRTLSSATMPYTGLLILSFVLYHLFEFRLNPPEPTALFAFVANYFKSPLNVTLYAAAMLVVALHVRHGLWSAFQTLGANHPKYMPGIEKLSILFGLLVAVGLGFIPIFFLFAVNHVAG